MKKIIVFVLIIIALVHSYFALDTSNHNPSSLPAIEKIQDEAVLEEAKEPEKTKNDIKKIKETPDIRLEKEIVKEEKSQPLQKKEKAEEIIKDLTCTLLVKCDTILNNIECLSEEKRELVPSDGIIFPETEVVFFEGENVFNILLREMKKNKIHLEFVNVPLYQSTYIEGIGNLYEFDSGELSGWMYKVNGVFPNYGCSKYQLKSGDKIEFVYTCDLGKDVGGDYYKNRG